MALELFSPNTNTSSCLGVLIGGNFPFLIPMVAKVMLARRLVRIVVLVVFDNFSLSRALRDNGLGVS